MRFDPVVEYSLRAMGWMPERECREQLRIWMEWAEGEGMPIHLRAKRALREFGGLKFTGGHPGVNCGTTPFEINPKLCAGEAEYMIDISKIVGEAVCPLGETDNGRSYMIMAESGIVFAAGDADVVLGASMDDALSRMIRGVRWDGHVPSEWVT